MKKKYSQSKTVTGPSKSKFSVLRQICNLIPPFLVSKLAHETGVDTRARSYSPWSHVVTLLYAQLVHAIGLIREQQVEDKRVEQLKMFND